MKPNPKEQRKPKWKGQFEVEEQQLNPTLKEQQKTKPKTEAV